MPDQDPWICQPIYEKCVFKLALTLISLAGLLFGIIALVSPIPVGILIIAISLSILICVNEKAREVLKAIRCRSHSFNQRIHALETKLEGRFKHLSLAFKQTRPAPNSESDDCQ